MEFLADTKNKCLIISYFIDSKDCLKILLKYVANPYMNLLFKSFFILVQIVLMKSICPLLAVFIQGHTVPLCASWYAVYTNNSLVSGDLKPNYPNSCGIYWQLSGSSSPISFLYSQVTIPFIWPIVFVQP